MKIRMILWPIATLILCLAAFWFGSTRSRPEYDQNPLAIDRALLVALRSGHTTNVVESLEAMLDLEILAAIHNRPSLEGRELKLLDMTLERVARYREQYPRPIDRETNGIPPVNLRGAATWIAEQQQIDAFLRRFIVTNESRIGVSPARRLSEQQVADIASRALPGVTRFSCQFNDGVWNVLAVQNDVWVSSVATNADGRVIVRSTNAMQLVLRVRDKDGQVEPVKEH